MAKSAARKPFPKSKRAKAAPRKRTEGFTAEGSAVEGSRG